MRAGGAPTSKVLEVSSAVIRFDVVDRDGERVGSVANVSLGRTCILVETGRSRLGRKQSHAVHALAVREIDVDAFTIFLNVSQEHVAEAPEFHALDQESETTIARYYYDRLTALGEALDANADEGR